MTEKTFRVIEKFFILTKMLYFQANSPVASQRAAMRAHMSYAARHQSYHSDLNLKPISINCSLSDNLPFLLIHDQASNITYVASVTYLRKW